MRLRHPDTGWEDYADGWQIVTSDGLVLGTRILLHPHEQEQPFTRSLSGVAISPEIEAVRVVAHDLVSGYTLSPFTIPLDASTTEEHYQVER
ncbi:MAG: hypothetical protein D6790_12720 [Caldilineae bacterium]|nr:MAG: hypothetical protein D6790_12720 [Caldilineae bacterium]